MGSSVGAFCDHYELLGLSPTASEHEIAQAFTKAMGVFTARPMASAAQIGLAFETLRNPAKRRAYDASLGIQPRLQPRNAPAGVSFRISARSVGSEARVEEHLGEPLPPAPPQSVLAAAPDASGEPRVASFIASSLREIASPAPLGSGVEAESEPPAPLPREVAIAEAEDASEAKQRTLRLKPIITGAGGLIIAAGVIGAVAATSVRGPKPQEVAVTSAIPPATAPQLTAAAGPAAPMTASVAMSNPIKSQPQQPRPQSTQRPKRSLVPQQPRSWVEQQLAESQPVDSTTAAETPAQVQTEQGAPDDATAQPAPATLPLPKNVIARTIERIGYSCGGVSSTDPVESAGPGVFKVTCTSGETYQAKPVRGRYHFRRVPSQ